MGRTVNPLATPSKVRILALPPLAHIAQQVEHFVGNEEVSSSSLLVGTIFFGGIAQLVRAHGSYPWRHWFESSYRYQIFRLRTVSFYFIEYKLAFKGDFVHSHQ